MRWETLTRTQASVGISQPCERPLVTSHLPSCSLFLPPFFSSPSLTPSPTFSSVILSSCLFSHLLSCFYEILWNTLALELNNLQTEVRLLFFSLFVLLSVRKLQQRRVYYRREVSSDGIQTIGEEKHDVLLVTLRTTWTDNNKSSR